MVVAAYRQNAAFGINAGEIGVFENVAGPVDAGRLAVPDAEHTVIVVAVESLRLL